MNTTVNSASIRQDVRHIDRLLHDHFGEMRRVNLTKKSGRRQRMEELRADIEHFNTMRERWATLLQPAV